MLFRCCCQKSTERFRGEFCGLSGMQILGKCASCGSSPRSPWHCQLCSVPARTAGTQSQAAADPCCSQTAPWVLSQPRGWEPPGLLLLLGEAEVGRQQRWSAQTGSSWNCVRICHTLLASDPSLLVLWFLMRKVPRSWFTLQHSPLLLIPPQLCFSRGFATAFQLFSPLEAACYLSSQMCWVL